MAPDELKRLDGLNRLGELISISSSISQQADCCNNEVTKNTSKSSPQMTISTELQVSEPADDEDASYQNQNRNQNGEGNQHQKGGKKRYPRYGSCDSTKSFSGEQAKQPVAEENRLVYNRQNGVSKQQLAEFDSQLVQQAHSNQALPPKSRLASHGSSSGSSSTSSSCGDEADGREEPLKQHKANFLERLAKVVPGLGIMMALCASVFLGTAGMLVKLTTSVHGIQVAVFRAAIQMLFYCAIIWLRGNKRWTPARKEWLPCTLRAVLGGSSITFSYYALKLIPLGDATSIRFSLPIWTLIMSYFFLNESCSVFKVCAVVMSVCGVVLIAKPDDCIYLSHLMLYSLGCESDDELSLHKSAYDQFKMNELASLVSVPDETLQTSGSTLLVMASSNSSSRLTAASGEQFDAVDRLPIDVDSLRQFEGCMMALASSICLAMSLIALRLCKRTPAEITILWLSVFSILIGSTTLLFLNEWRLPNNMRDVIYIVLNGVCGSIGQWFITSALKVEQSGIIALARTFDIEIAFLYSALLLNEAIRTTSIIGSVMVSLGVIIVVVPKWLSARGTSDDSNQASAIEPDDREDAPRRVAPMRLPACLSAADASNDSTTTTTTTMTTAPAERTRPTFEDKS